jgi:hypothetical protein
MFMKSKKLIQDYLAKVQKYKRELPVNFLGKLGVSDTGPKLEAMCRKA